MAIQRTAPPTRAEEVIAPPETYEHPIRCHPDTNPDILVLCDAPDVQAAWQQIPMSMNHLRFFAARALQAGFVQGDMMFVGLCPPIKKSEENSAAKKWKHVEQYQARVREIIAERNPKVVVTLGELASRAMFGRPVKITKQRGMATTNTYDQRLTFPMLSPKTVTKNPDNVPIFDADLSTLKRLKDEGYDPRKLQPDDVNYRWCVDLTELLENKPQALAVDTETNDLNFRALDFEVHTVQLTPRPGVTYVCPVGFSYCDKWRESFEEMGLNVSQRNIMKLRRQVKQLLENPEISKLANNLKYDNGALRHGLGINVVNWGHDMELMCRAVNENMFTYSLDDITRIYVPSLAGYADHFNQVVDKSRMIDVQPNDILDTEGNVVKPGMLRYAGGDPDATFRCGRALYPILAREPGQLFLYNRVQMRGLIAFGNRVEVHGQCIDREALEAYTKEVAEWVAEEEIELFKLIPAPVRHKWLFGEKATQAADGRTVQNILYGKDDFIRDVLFHHPDGFNLTPKVFTKSTAKAENPADRVASVSTKDHMPYFVTVKKKKAGEWVLRYIELAKAKKLLTTYLDPFDKYIKPSNDNTEAEKIFPSYNFRTNTSRTNSQDPNGQNFPKRGKFAGGFLKLIRATPGKVLVAADLSQIELRLTAWTANEPTMLEIYRTGGDIHQATAAAVMRLTIDQFLALDPKEQKLQRFRAKAVNFGFIYGAQWRTFQTYAKTNYGVDYTDKEAQETRELFFAKYSRLPAWHQEVEAFVKRHGYVPTLHGGIRHLPSVWSDDWGISTGAVRQAINAPIQRFGSDFGVIAIARLAAQADPDLMRPIGFVHDQVITEVDPGYVDQAMGWLCWVMENPPLQSWFNIQAPLPIVADPDFGPNLYEAVEVKRNEQGIYLRDDTKELLPNVRNEMPEWWDTDEEGAWDRFIRNQVTRFDFAAQEHHVRQMLAAE
jgi:DNA polymerase I-like protein with 3'-5' exonuclease and polymerase domains